MILTVVVVTVSLCVCVCVCVLVFPGEVVRLEVVSQLFAALLLLLSALFTLLPVSSSRDVQHRLAGQNLPVQTHTHTHRHIKVYI